MSYPPPDPSWQPPPTQAVGQDPPTSEERNWAVAAHVGSILTAWFALGLVAPLVVLLLKGNESQYVRRNAVESLNFQLNALVLSILFGLLMFVLIGFILLPLYGIFWLVCVIAATVQASNGREFRYPLTVRVVS
jgi:uncharacterized Tic20 family protein